MPASYTRVKGVRVRRSSTRTWTFAYCQDCLGHQQAHEDAVQARKKAWIVLSLIVPALLLSLLKLTWLLVAAALIWWAVHSFRRAKDAREAIQLNPGCATVFSAVAYRGWYASVHTFAFANPAYAEVFMQLNQDKLVSHPLGPGERSSPTRW